MQIKVYNNNELVHDGTLQQFLDDNDGQMDYIAEMLKHNNTITLHELSGTWKIVKQ